MVTVTQAYGDTLTWRGRVDIHGLSMDGHSYSQLSTKQLCPSMDGRGLSTAPLDISEGKMKRQELALLHRLLLESKNIETIL